MSHADSGSHSCFRSIADDQVPDPAVASVRSGDEALANAREAIACHIEGLLATGDEMPWEVPPLIPLVIEIELKTRMSALTG
jgi:hypothetical protein